MYCAWPTASARPVRRAPGAIPRYVPSAWPSASLRFLVQRARLELALLDSPSPRPRARLRAPPMNARRPRAGRTPSGSTPSKLGARGRHRAAENVTSRCLLRHLGRIELTASASFNELAGFRPVNSAKAGRALRRGPRPDSRPGCSSQLPAATRPVELHGLSGQLPPCRKGAQLSVTTRLGAESLRC